MVVTYVDVERTVREVYRLPIDKKLAETMGPEELIRVAVKTGALVSQEQYEAHLVDSVQPEEPHWDKYMREKDFWS